MAYSAEVIAAVRAGYVHERQPLEAAARRHGVPDRTVRRWKADAAEAGDNWDQARAAGALAGGSRELLMQAVIEDYIALHQATQRALLDGTGLNPLERAEALGRLADAFAKTMAAVGKASPALSEIAITGRVLQDLAGWVQREAPEAAEALLSVLEPFGRWASREYGS